MTINDNLASALSPDEFNDSLPKQWLAWPTHVELAFTLTEGSAVTSDDYGRFRSESLYKAALLLFDPTYRRRHFRYSLKSDGFLPAYRYDAQWSLLRRGSTGGVWRRQREQHAEPCSYGADSTILDVWRQPLTQHTYKSRLWLRTGGRTEAEAVRTWETAARAFRQLGRSIERK